MLHLAGAIFLAYVLIQVVPIVLGLAMLLIGKVMEVCAFIIGLPITLCSLCGTVFRTLKRKNPWA